MSRLTAQDFFTRTGRRERSEPVDRQDVKVGRGTDGCPMQATTIVPMQPSIVFAMKESVDFYMKPSSELTSSIFAMKPS